MSWGLSCAVFLLLLLSGSIAHRDGARNNESCYGHEVDHEFEGGIPVLSKQNCIGACSYNLVLVGEVDNTTLEIVDDNVMTLMCGSVYRCELFVICSVSCITNIKNDLETWAIV